MGDGQALVLMAAVCVVVVLCGSMGAVGDTLGDQCSDAFQKLPTCLTFATGKAAAPTKDCCTSVTTIKDSKPVCLCYIIQQFHTGTNSQLKSFGIQELKLLQLPSACKLTNASSADCPKLLNIPANSPDAAIFTDPSRSTATPAAPKGTSAPVTTYANDSSNGIKNNVPQLAAGSLAISIAAAAAVFFCALIQ